MATKPTDNPIPSESPKDLKFNAGNLDKVMNSDEEAYQDRFGKARLTMAGFEAESQRVLRSVGWSLLDSFQSGAILTSVNQALKWALSSGDGEYYRWDGVFPKVVPENSTPESTGGVGTGAWVGIGDASLRAKIANGDGSEVGIYPSGTLRDAVTTITPQQYNAKADGESDDTAAINAAFVAAKDINVKVVGVGTYLVSGPIDTFGVVFDFSSANFIVDGEKMGNDTMLLQITEPDTQVIEGFDLISYVAGQGGTPSLELYDECSVAINSTENAYFRSGSPGYELKKQDILVVNKAVHRITPAMFDISSVVTLTVKPLRKEIHCKLPVFVINTAPTERLGALVYISRNNVKVTGGFVNSESLSSTSNRNILESYIRIEKCAFPVVTDVTTKMSPLNYSYQVVADQVHGLIMERCRDQTGWRLQDGNWLRNTTVRDCEGRGIGTHAMAYNYTVENFTNCYNGIHVTGKGKLTVKNTRHVDFGGNLSNGGVVKIREDYGTSWDGDIDIDGVSILVGSTSSAATSISILEMWAAYTGTKDYTQESIRWGRSISINNVHVENLSSKQLALTSIDFGTALVQKITPPSEIHISNFSFKGDARPLVSGFPLYADSKVAPVTTTMYISNIQNNSGLSDLSHTVPDADKPNIPNKVIRKYQNYTGLNLTLSLPSGHKTYVYDSVVVQINGFATDLGYHYFYNCRMTGTEFSTNQGYNHFYNCHFDTATAGFKVGTRLTVGCHINSGAEISSGGGGVTSAANLWSYKSSIYA